MVLKNKNLTAGALIVTMFIPMIRKERRINNSVVLPVYLLLTFLIVTFAMGTLIGKGALIKKTAVTCKRLLERERLLERGR